jgi:hypothetical protein
MLSLLANSEGLWLYFLLYKYCNKICILSLMLSLLANSQGLWLYFLLHIHCYKGLCSVSNAVFVSKLTRFVALFSTVQILLHKKIVFLKGQCHKIFDFCFFHESASPKPLSIPLGPFQFFSKIRGDIRSSRCTTGVVNTGGKRKKSSIIKVLIILFGHLWEVEKTYRSEKGFSNNIKGWWPYATLFTFIILFTLVHIHIYLY